MDYTDRRPIYGFPAGVKRPGGGDQLGCRYTGVLPPLPPPPPPPPPLPPARRRRRHQPPLPPPAAATAAAARSDSCLSVGRSRQPYGRVFVGVVDGATRDTADY